MSLKLTCLQIFYNASILGSKWNKFIKFHLYMYELNERMCKWITITTLVPYEFFFPVTLTPLKVFPFFLSPCILISAKIITGNVRYRTCKKLWLFYQICKNILIYYKDRLFFTFLTNHPRGKLLSCYLTLFQHVFQTNHSNSVWVIENRFKRRW